MRELGRLIAAVLLLGLAGSAMAVPTPTPTPPASVELIAAEKGRADKAERDLAIQTAAREIESRQSDNAFARFEILIGLFGTLMTVLVVYFSFRNERTAAAEARLAAYEAIEKIRDEIGTLRSQAETAAIAAADAATRTAEAAVAAMGNRDRAEASAAEAEAIRQRAAAGASIADAAAASTIGRATKPDLTEDQSQALQAAARDIEGLPEADWTIDQFKVAIGKALYIDYDLPLGLHLATMMAKVHRADPDALIYALNRRGDAEREMDENLAALRSYEQAIETGSANRVNEWQTEILWARHHRGIALGDLGRVAESEAVLTELLPVRERINGPTHPDTLSARYAIARLTLDRGQAREAESKLRAVLELYEHAYGKNHEETLTVRHDICRTLMEQGRPDEAEAEFRSLWPLMEAIKGPASFFAYVTLYNWAWAALEAGHIDEAARIVEPIPPMIVSGDWTLRNAARLAFVRGQIADAQGHRDRAGIWLSEAQKAYAASYPPDYSERVKFDAYMANRQGGDSPHA